MSDEKTVPESAEEVTEKDTEITEAAYEEQQAPPEPPAGVPVTIDGKVVYADEGELLIAAAERHGTYIPRFCYHERLRPVGMCRMCLVEVDSGRGPMLSPACLVECSADMKVETKSEKALKAQDGVIEFLLVNHPLDCPVCDKGGECPLQDQTIAFGPGETRMVEEKRHREKPIPLSDLVLLDRERCILCDRCTRFADEVAGDPLISFIQRGVETEVNTFPTDPFASYFSGNTVQLCPVGALTAKPYRFVARPWDLDAAESTCTTCAVGCRIAVQSQGRELSRYLGIDSDPVNHGWLCDKGRFAYEAINNVGSRVTVPMVRQHGELVEVGWGEALAAAAKGIKDAVDRHGPGSVGIIGGARLTNEDAFAWAKLATTVIKTPNVDCQLDDGLPGGAGTRTAEGDDRRSVQRAGRDHTGARHQAGASGAVLAPACRGHEWRHQADRDHTCGDVAHGIRVGDAYIPARRGGRGRRGSGRRRDGTRRGCHPRPPVDGGSRQLRYRSRARTGREVAGREVPLRAAPGQRPRGAGSWPDSGQRRHGHRRHAARRLQRPTGGPRAARCRSGHRRARRQPRSSAVSPAPASPSPSTRRSTRRRRAPMSSCRRRRSPSGPAPPPTSRAASPASPRKSRLQGSPGRTG